MKTDEMRARCSELELKALRAIAEAEDLRPTEVLRELVRTEAKRRGLWPAADLGDSGHQIETKIDRPHMETKETHYE